MHRVRSGTRNLEAQGPIAKTAILLRIIDMGHARITGYRISLSINKRGGSLGNFPQKYSCDS